jgi:hypothetical protein
MSRYVDPLTIVDPNAKPLTSQETDFQMQDSFRTGRVFIKSHQDPPIPAVPQHYQFLLQQLREHTDKSKETDIILDELANHFTQNQPLQAYCWHLFEEPSIVTGTDGKQYKHYGWMKLRGQFSTYGEMETEVRNIMQDHDSYTRTYGQQKGVFFPITNAPFVTEEALQQVYDKDVKRQDDIQKQMIALTRKREETLQEMQKDVEEGSLEDYIRQKLKFCVADTMIIKAKGNIERFTPILAKQSKLVETMEKSHPDYHDRGLQMYQDKMKEIGYPVPTSFYDGCVPLGMN